MNAKSRGIKKKDFAKRCGRPTKIISEIVAGKCPITPTTALQFERVLGESAEYWLNLNSKFQVQQERAKESLRVSEAETQQWIQKFPVREMVDKGFIAANHSLEERLDALLKFFGISSIELFEDYWDSRANLARFKQNSHNKCDEYAVAAWLRQGEISASKIPCEPFDKKSFRNLLPRIKELTKLPWTEVEGSLIDLCASVGVAVALVPNLPKTGLREEQLIGQEETRRLSC